MRECRNWIIGKCQEIYEKFPGVKVRYYWDPTSEYNVVQVGPESIHRECETYVRFERDIWEEFMKEYPEEDILIEGFPKDPELREYEELIYDKS